MRNSIKLKLFVWDFFRTFFRLLLEGIFFSIFGKNNVSEFCQSFSRVLLKVFSTYPERFLRKTVLLGFFSDVLCILVDWRKCFGDDVKAKFYMSRRFNSRKPFCFEKFVVSISLSEFLFKKSKELFC